MFFKKKESTSTNSYQLGYSDGYNAGIRGNSKVYGATFNKDRGYITGYEQGYRNGNMEYRNRNAFKKSDASTPLVSNNNNNDIRRQVEAQREINLGQNNFKNW